MAPSLLKKLFFLLLAISLLPVVSQAKSLPSDFPRKANYYLLWELNDSRVRELAKWDVVILDMEVQTQPELLKKLRQLNPKIILLAYITSEEIIDNAAACAGQMRRKLASQLSPAWYLKSSSGELLSFWPGTHLLNVTNDAPAVNGWRFNQYLAKFVSEQILNSRLWDGVFYDNVWGDVKWLGNDFDANNDGVNDGNIDAKWREGMKVIFSETRRLTNNQYLIVGNGNTREYRDELNGKLIESFIPAAWTPTMNTYVYNFSSVQSPAVNIINANTANSGKVDYKNIRFGLASALLENGYFSYDYGDQDHGQTWWYDEYNVNLGEPLDKAVSRNNYQEYKADVWQRNFANGLALVNSTGEKKTVSLGGEYEKIHGIQDPRVNDGSIITETSIEGYDGLLLLKTFASVQDVLFRNGDFLRFFDANGNRSRNGFFVSESGYKGGDKIARIDLDGNGKRDLLVVSKNKILAWRDDGQIYLRLYPYTVNYQGELRVALGDLNQDGFLEVYIAPGLGYPLPIKIYTRHGRQMKRDWYPFGEKYFGGYSLAVGNVSNGDKNDLVVAKASAEPLVSIFDYNYNLAYQWLAFDKHAGYGINVAVGNVDGLDAEEVIVGAGKGAKPMIRIFDRQGKLTKEFSAYSAFDKPGIEVLAVDVDDDGKEDIVGMSSGF